MCVRVEELSRLISAPPHLSLDQQSNQPLQTPDSSCITNELLFSKTESTIMASNVTSSMGGLKIADKTFEADRQVPGPSSSALQDSIEFLDQYSKIISSQAQQARDVAGSVTHLNSLDITKVHSLSRIASDITVVTRILNDTTNTLREKAELSIVASLTPIGSQGGANVRDGSLLQRMLSHFNYEIRDIVRDVLSNSAIASSFHGRLQSVTGKRLVASAHYIPINISLSSTTLVVESHTTLIMRLRNIMNTKVAWMSMKFMPRPSRNKWNNNGNGDKRKGRRQSKVGSTLGVGPSQMPSRTDAVLPTSKQRSQASNNCDYRYPTILIPDV